MPPRLRLPGARVGRGETRDVGPEPRRTSPETRRTSVETWRPSAETRRTPGEPADTSPDEPRARPPSLLRLAETGRVVARLRDREGPGAPVLLEVDAEEVGEGTRLDRDQRLAAGKRVERGASVP